MAVLITTICIAVIIALVGLGIGIYNRIEKDTNAGFFSLLATPLALITLLFGCFAKVGANQVGIIYDDRYGVQDKTLGEGFQTKSIFEHITSISTTNRNTIITNTTAQTNDGQYVTIDLTLIYKIEKENAGKFYKVTGNTDLSKEQLTSLTKQALQASTINYDIFSAMSERLEDVRVQFQEELKTSLMNNYNVTLVSASFDDIDGGTRVEEILQAKAEAEQKIDIAMKEAEAKQISAEAEAKVKKTLADAEAYAVKVAGEGAAEAATAYIEKINAMIENIQTSTGMSYNDSASLVLSIVFYDTWNGELPQVLTSDSLSALIGSLIKNGSNKVGD